MLSTPQKNKLHTFREWIVLTSEELSWTGPCLREHAEHVPKGTVENNAFKHTVRF